MKRKFLAFSSMLAMAATAQTALANSGTISFDGSINASTCEVRVNGTMKDGVVNLPVVASSLLKAAGDTTGRTHIKFELENCTVATNPTSAKVFFNMGDTINTAGRLDIDTTVALPATNVDLQLLGTDNRAIDLTLDADNQSTAPSTQITAGKATMLYGVQYYATGTGAGVGKVSSSVGYEINYE